VVADVDLAKFFDRANHDMVTERLSRKIAEKGVLGLIRRYLEAGVMVSGVMVERHEGTPQGGPLSPLLANALLDDVDKELERRGHAFVRYADDLNVYGEGGAARLRSVEEALREVTARGQRGKERGGPGVEARLSRLQLLGGRRRTDQAPGGQEGSCGNEGACARDHQPQRRTEPVGGRWGAEGIPARLEEYFKQAETPGVFEDVDKWIRHRLRCLQLKQWKRGTTVFCELRARGASKDVAAQVAANTRRWWHNSAKLLNSVLPNRYFDELGVPRLAPRPQPTEPPDAHPHVRWCRRGAAVTYRRPLSRSPG